MRLARQAQTAVGLGGLTAGAGLCACLQTSRHEIALHFPQQLISVHREDAFCSESALPVDVHASGGGGNNLWRNIEEELPVIFYLWAGVVMTLDGARRLLQAQHAGTDVEACLHVSRAPC